MFSDSTILRHIARQPKKTASHKQLLHDLGARGNARRELTDRLLALVQKGELRQDADGRYAIPHEKTNRNALVGRLSMHSEAQALAGYVREHSMRSFLIVSSPVYLRRASLSFRRALRKYNVRLTFVAVPGQMPPRSQIWSEFRRYLLYLLCGL